MTKEEVIKEITKLIQYGGLVGISCHEALEIAIKSLDILDKIRSDIEREIVPKNSDQYDHEAMWQNCGLRIALKIIDKYK